MAKIRVLLADDHAILRAGLQMLIDGEPDMEVVAEAADSHQAFRKASAVRPDVVILDLAMPGDSIRQIERLRRECPQTRILVLTAHSEEAYLRAALAAGASGYLIKAVDLTELLNAIRAVHQGRVFVDLKFHPSLRQTLLSGKGDGTPPGRGPDPAPLSRRERQVLTLLAQGYTNQQIADRLFLSVKTVETYRARIAEKLNLRDRAALFRYAAEMGLLLQDKDDPQ